ncbi:hypothetical protein [Methylomonas sp. CM2]|uniref:hypothetical protein n=1 Tax=Methylomonas sp. CM2 TaxID=3417647 RepID=UPI003CFA680A
MDSAIFLEELRIPPGNRLEALSGKEKGNTVFALTISLEFVSSGRSQGQTRSKSSITTRGDPWYAYQPIENPLIRAKC